MAAALCASAWPTVLTAAAAVTQAASSGETAWTWWYLLEKPPILVTTLVSGVFGLAGTAIALQFSWWNTRKSLAAGEGALNQKVNEAELAAIQAKLDTFYGPYLQRSKENGLLADEFRARQPDGFRTLLKLVEPGWFDGLSKADATIVEEIVANGAALRTLLRERAGAVDPAVLPYLARAGTHFTMLLLGRRDRSTAIPNASAATSIRDSSIPSWPLTWNA